MSSYFHQLNYSFANEGTDLEATLVEQEGLKSILAVCGSGLRGLHLLNGQTEALDLIDLSRQQLDWAKLMVNSFQNLDHGQFTKLWCDEEVHVRERQKIINQLPPVEAKFLESQLTLPLFYWGRWEKTFRKMSRFVRFLIPEEKLRHFVLTPNLQEQRDYYLRSFPKQKWSFILFVLGNRAMFNHLLYKGHFVQKNIPESYYSFYLRCYQDLFNNSLLKDNYFIQLCFFGKVIHQNAWPSIIQPGHYSHFQPYFSQTKINYIQDHILHFADQKHKTYDFVSLSDVPSYFASPQDKNFLQKLRPSLRPGAYIVVRYYLKVCQPDTKGYQDRTQDFQDLIEGEKVPVYRIKIYQLI